MHKLATLSHLSRPTVLQVLTPITFGSVIDKISTFFPSLITLNNIQKITRILQYINHLHVVSSFTLNSSKFLIILTFFLIPLLFFFLRYKCRVNFSNNVSLHFCYEPSIEDYKGHCSNVTDM